MLTISKMVFKHCASQKRHTSSGLRMSGLELPALTHPCRLFTLLPCALCRAANLPSTPPPAPPLPGLCAVSSAWNIFLPADSLAPTRFPPAIGRPPLNPQSEQRGALVRTYLHQGTQNNACDLGGARDVGIPQQILSG